jgi:drug/metabolite transporter superfamily protein YnfA
MADQIETPLAQQHSTPPPLHPAPTPPPLPGAVTPQLWRQGNILLVPSGLPLPDVCVKCAGPTDARRRVVKLLWHEQWIYLLILVAVIVYAVVATILNKKTTLNIGYCARCAARRRNHLLIGWLIVLAGVGAIVLAIALDNGAYAAFGGLGILVGLIWAIVATPILKPTRIDDWGNAWVKGVHPDFLAQVPEWRG